MTLPSPRTLATALAVVLLLAVGSSYVGQARADRNAAVAGWQTADSTAVVQRSRANALGAEALLADSRATAEKARADSLAVVARTARVVYRDVRAAAPDICAPVIAAADSALAADSAESETLRTALQSSREATKAALAGKDSLAGAIDRLRAAGAVVVAVAKPSLAERLTPRPGIGFAAGVDNMGKPHIIAGVTFGWRF